MIKKDRKTREEELHSKLAHEYKNNREGNRNGRYYSKQWLRHMIKLIEIPKNSKILDVGCGTGILYEVLQEEKITCRYVGVDLSKDMIEVGRKRYSGIDLREMDAEKLEFKNREFDIVFMRAVLHHLPNPVDSLKEMKRVSRNKIMISEPARNILTTIPRFLLKKFTSHFDEEHTHFSRKQFKKILLKAKIKGDIYHFSYLAYPFGFTDILPMAKYLPLNILKFFLKLDEIIEKIPIIRYFSWQLIAISKNK